MEKKSVKKEFIEHIPFTAIATLIAVILVVLSLEFTINISENLFEIFHPLHIIFSAFVTSAIYYKYKKNIFQSLIIGLTGSILIGSLSDVILPYLEANLLNLETSFHLPIVESPLIIILASLLGGILGVFLIKTKMPHFLHVFLSVFASLFYITAYSQNLSTIYLIASFFIVFIAVIIPCCLSDIIYPLLFIKDKD